MSHALSHQGRRRHFAGQAQHTRRAREPVEVSDVAHTPISPDVVLLMCAHAGVLSGGDLGRMGRGSMGRRVGGGEARAARGLAWR